MELKHNPRLPSCNRGSPTSKGRDISIDCMPQDGTTSLKYRREGGEGKGRKEGEGGKGEGKGGKGKKRNGKEGKRGKGGERRDVPPLTSSPGSASDSGCVQKL